MCASSFLSNGNHNRSSQCKLMLEFMLGLHSKFWIQGHTRLPAVRARGYAEVLLRSATMQQHCAHKCRSLALECSFYFINGKMCSSNARVDDWNAEWVFCILTCMFQMHEAVQKTRQVSSIYLTVKVPIAPSISPRFQSSI